MKILLLLPDGVGVRNFIYTDFIDKAIKAGHEIIVWADEDILSPIDDSRVKKIKFPAEPFTTSLIEAKRKAWQTGTLKYWARHFNDNIYLEYIIRPDIGRINGVLKPILVKFLLLFNRSGKQLACLKRSYLRRMTELPYFGKCITQLRSIEPDVILCTHQRALNAIAPLLAARALNIRNACFIYSWDNLPKATMFVEADHYLVWSEHMRNELLQYYPEVKPENILITGTPQFIPYFDDSLKKSRERFASECGLPADRKWICYSGGDTRTSPFDPIYLSHLSEAVRDWNRKSESNLHILFRRCPVDLSDRFEKVLNANSDILTPVAPRWGSVNKNAGWDRVVPGKEDVSLLVNTALHCDMVINVGSTMAFDFNIFGKPALFINYNVGNIDNWDVHKIYEFTHFRSIGSLQPVLWINSRADIPVKIGEAYESLEAVEDCKKWHQKITLHPLELANDRIINALETISHLCTSVS